MAETCVISISIVHYKVKDELFACLTSIYKQKTKHTFEILVVDNDEIPTIEKELKKKFPKVRYIKSTKNSGYSGGHNLASTYAKGEYLFFLNPDTVFASNILDSLVSFIKKNTHVGVAAPLLLDKNTKPYELQGTKTLGFLEAFTVLTVINKWFPKNPIAKAYWHLGWDKTKTKQVAVVPGTAFLINKKVFEDIGKFDQRYFLFFEEYDLCRRLIEKGYKNYIVPSATLIHLWGISTKKRDDIESIFAKSRFFYFQKFYGSIPAFLIESILRFSSTTLALIGIVFVSVFLRFYGLEKYMLYIGDFGWFYLSARDLLLTGDIPLIGIASSHPWIHQGPFWTYMLATSLWLGNFNPLSGGYLAAGIGVLTTMVLYLFVKEMFGNRIALFTAAFFATSPLIIFHTRLPYHTSPIPLFVLLYIYAVYKWIKGSTIHLPFAIFWLVVLYNFELASFVLTGVLGAFVIYGFWKKTEWFQKSFSPKILFFSLGAFLIPLLPMLLHDISHGYPQTLKFLAWIGYRILVLFGYPPLRPDLPSGTYGDMLPFLGKTMQEFFYSSNIVIAGAFAAASIGVFIWSGVKQVSKSNKNVYVLLFLSFFIPFGAIVVGKTPSDAYLPMLFIQASIYVGILFSFLSKKTKIQTVAAASLFILLCTANGLASFQSNFGAKHAVTITQRINASKEIIALANGKPYQLIGQGVGSNFPSFTMNYQYLTWWLGVPPEKNAIQKIILKENEREIILYRK